MKIIFLDIDGVLNSTTSYYFNNSNEKLVKYLISESDKKDNIDIHNVSQLSLHNCANLSKILLEVPEAKIVISSTWRKRLSIDELNDLLHTMGVSKPHKCIVCNGVGHLFNFTNGFSEKGSDCKKCSGNGLNNNQIDYNIIIDKTPVVQGASRGDEIKTWIQKNKSLNISHFVILDDDSDMGEYKESNHFIQTNPDNGLTYTDSEKAIKSLY